MGKCKDWIILHLVGEPHHIGFVQRWNVHCLTIYPISSHDAWIQLSHHIGFSYSHQLMIHDLELISTSTSQIQQIAHRILTANKRFKNTIPKSQETTNDWLKGMKRCKTHQANHHYWHAKHKRIARKTTNPYDYAQMPSWRQIGSDKAKKWHISGDLRQLSMHKKDCSRFRKKMDLSKGGFPKSRKIPVFCYFQPQICVISFLVDNYTQKHTQRLKTLKTRKTAFYKV